MQSLIMTAVSSASSDPQYGHLKLTERISNLYGSTYDVSHSRWIPEILSYNTEIDMNLEYEDALHLFAVIVNKHELEIL